ncbi:hypothetical protein AAMO2058_000374200 [Amorphochlora amoebiformis]
MSWTDIPKPLIFQTPLVKHNSSIPQNVQFRFFNACHNMQMIDHRIEKLQQSRPRPINHFPLLISTTVFEAFEYVVGHLVSLLAFTQPNTLIVIHLNKNTKYTKDQIEKLWDMGRGRIILNHVRIEVLAYHGSLARSILSNLEVVRDLGITFHHVMLMCSNAWLVCPGVEDHISVHGSSRTSPILWEEVRKDRGEHSPRAFFWGPMVQFVRGGRNMDEVSSTNPMWKSKHEGAFFPADLAFELIDGLKAFQVGGNFKNALDELCGINTYLEEFLFQTYVTVNINRVKGKAGSSPPLIAVFTGSHRRGGWKRTDVTLQT